MKRSIQLNVTAISWAATLLLATVCHADVSQQTGTCGPGTVEVRHKVKIKNLTGQSANDIHLYAYQNDRPHVQVLGAKAKVIGNHPNGLIGINLDSDNDRKNPPPGNHGAKVDAKGLTPIPNNQSIELELTLCMNERNMLKLKDIRWTNNGVTIMPPKGKKGWRIERSTPAGMASITQQGLFMHAVSIENDSDFPFVLKDVRLFPSPTYFADIENDINWAAIPPVSSGSLPSNPPYTIPPHGTWSYPLETPTSMVGEHIYLSYTTAEPDALPEDDETSFGDHPVEALCDDPGCETFPTPPFGTCCNLVMQTCISSVQAHDCTGINESWSDIMGACCGPGGCFRETQLECQFSAGEYNGDNSLCVNQPDCVPLLSASGVIVFALLIMGAGVAMSIRARRNSGVPAC